MDRIRLFLWNHTSFYRRRWFGWQPRTPKAVIDEAGDDAVDLFEPGVGYRGGRR